MSNVKPLLTLPMPYDELRRNWRKKRFVRDAYRAFQDDACCICGGLLAPYGDAPKKTRENLEILEAVIGKGEAINLSKLQRWPTHLHHNHETGLTVGAAHGACNIWLWISEGK